MSSEPNNDTLHRFTLADDQLRGEIVTLKDSWHQAVDHQNLPQPVRRLLGEFLAASALLGEILKFEGTLTLQIRGSGPLPLIMAEATSERTLRGVAKLAEDASRDTLPEDFQPLIGAGVLTLTIDPYKGKRYQGIVPLEGESLSQCLSHYFSQSEQLPTAFWLSADDTSAAGMLLQVLPAADNVTSTPELWETAVQLADTVKPEELTGLDHATVLYRLFHELEVTLFESHPVAFACGCTRERSANALRALPEQEAYELLREQGSIAMDCHFCGTHYRFDEKDIQHIYNPQPATRH